MSKIEVGSVLEGKVTGIQPYGAFVALNEEKQGLVHISEVAHGFVKDINEYLSVGQEVQVKVLSVDEEKGKISLSIRATQEAPAQEAPKPRRAPKATKTSSYSAASQTEAASGFNTLKDKLQDWIAQSDDRQSLLKK
ncbi:RNA-binding protein S1 [Lottiidibacillus patelloidae]|uniref:RNA-binding protein S1 n=1 Tax=Lottiidibacillus patelloidae TaxID=2670334 RepID=A0A263BR46_9BACI|nr:S1 domain-containing post-transcriptional regulator GSP13 [Lottiidibacillus patelloidae]OZM56185.1 RNA-binding protein S1 [Lottiidibacillus patelloidae]